MSFGNCKTCWKLKVDSLDKVLKEALSLPSYFLKDHYGKSIIQSLGRFLF